MACGAITPSDVAMPERPMRIVSLDYCADQYVLKLADREQILAISPDGVKSFSYMRAAAEGVPTVRSIAEDVLVLKPDLVVRSYGGGPNAMAFFEGAGIPVLQVGWSSNLNPEGQGSIPAVIAQMAEGLGQAERGNALIAEFQTRLNTVQAGQDERSALYMTLAGVTTGPGSLIHEMLQAAGLTNFQEEAGWHSLPLERLAYEQPDIIAAAFFESAARSPDAWSASRHPIARRQLSNQTVIPLEGAWTACGGWFLMDAVEALAAGTEP